MPKPIIVTAELGPEDQASFDRLRRRHFPPERNLLAAHLTMFHAIPPSALDELGRIVSTLTERAPPRAEAAGIMDLGGGTAVRIVSEDLRDLREEIARRLHGLLSAQDSGGWAPHITVQNKVGRSTARSLQAELRATFEPREIRLRGIGLHHYLGGPWQTIRIYPFRGN